MATKVASDDTYADGVLVASVELYDDGTAVEVVDGKAGAPRPCSESEAGRVQEYLGRVPLDDLGALATLLAVKGTISVKDAAAIANTTEAKIIAEAEAWAIPTKPVAPKP